MTKTRRKKKKLNWHLYSHLLWSRSAFRDSGGTEQGVVGAGHAPGADEATGEGGERGARSGRGCVGGGGRCCFLHQESAGTSRRSEPAD